MHRRAVRAALAIFACLSYVSCALAQLHEHVDATILLSQDKLDEAESKLSKVINGNNDDVQALSLLGEVARRKGANSKSLKLLNKAIAIDPTYPDAYLYKGKLLFSMQKPDEMSGEFDMYIRCMEQYLTDGAMKRIYIANVHEICGIYYGLKMYEELKRALDSILKFSPSDQAAMYNLGIYYYTHERNRSGAYGSFKRVIEADPKSEMASKAKYAIEFMRENPDPRVAPSFSFIEKEYRD